jgi:hypothetical protein
MIEYAKLYLNLVEDGYRSIWWKLFNAADAKKKGLTSFGSN